MVIFLFLFVCFCFCFLLHSKIKPKLYYWIMLRIESRLFIHFRIQYIFIELTMCQVFFCVLVIQLWLYNTKYMLLWNLLYPIGEDRQ